MLPVCPSVKLTLCGKAGGDKGANVTPTRKESLPPRYADSNFDNQFLHLSGMISSQFKSKRMVNRLICAKARYSGGSS
jgi:hypothetical protein